MLCRNHFWKAAEQSGSGGLETERIAFRSSGLSRYRSRAFDPGSGTKGNWGTRSFLYCSRARSASSKDSRYPGLISTTSRFGGKDTGSGHAAVLDGVRLYCDCLWRCPMAGPELTEASSALPKRDRMLSSFCSIFFAWLLSYENGLVNSPSLLAAGLCGTVATYVDLPRFRTGLGGVTEHVRLYLEHLESCWFMDSECECHGRGEKTSDRSGHRWQKHRATRIWSWPGRSWHKPSACRTGRPWACLSQKVWKRQEC